MSDEYTLTDEQREAAIAEELAKALYRSDINLPMADPLDISCRDVAEVTAPLVARMVADAEQRGYWEGRDAEANERIKYGIETGSLTKYALDRAKAAGRAEVSAAVEAVIERVSDVRHYGRSHTPYRNGAEAMAGRVRDALTDPAPAAARSEFEALREAADKVDDLREAQRSTADRIGGESDG